MLDSISTISINKVPFKGAIQEQKSSEKQTEKQSDKNWMLWTGLAVLGAAGIYVATRGKKASETVEKTSEAVQNAATCATDTVKEQAAKILEKLPSRKEVLESLGVKLNNEKLLTVMKKGADGKEIEKLYTGTYSYTARKGVNIEEYVEDGIVRARTMSTQKTIDNPVIKKYEYYHGQNLRGIKTFKDNRNVVTFTLKNQKAYVHL